MYIVQLSFVTFGEVIMQRKRHHVCHETNREGLHYNTQCWGAAVRVYECTVIVGVIAQCAVDFLNVSVLSFYRTAGRQLRYVR